MAKLNHKNLGEVQKTAYLTATITTVDGGNDTACFTGIGKCPAGTDIPIFYHCQYEEGEEPAQRDNGALEGASGAFSKDDEVIIQCEVLDSTTYKPLYVMGFVDKPKQCCYAVEMFKTGKNNYEWLNIETLGNFGTFTNNSNFNNDKFTLSITAEGQPVGTWEDYGAKYYTKCFEKPWSNNAGIYLIIDISDDIKFSGTSDVPLQVEFSVIFTSTQWGTWATYVNKISRNDFPAGKVSGLYYADVSQRLLDYGWDLDACIFRAYSVGGSIHLNYDREANISVGINSYKLCQHYPDDAVELGGHEQAYSIGTIDTYTGIYKC